MKDTKDDLRRAAVRLGIRDGITNASVRTITREAGLTEGALYRHYATKDDLLRDAYAQIVAELARDKQVLLEAELPFRAALRAWIKVTYAFFDGNRDAFTYVLLMPGRIAEPLGELHTRQGRLFQELYTRAVRAGEARGMEPLLASASFAGLMLEIPRRINNGELNAPASQYTDHTADAAWRVLAPTD